MGLGSWWWLPWAFVVWIGIGSFLSPVSRAGWESVLLLPAGLGVVGAARRTATEAKDRDRLLSGLALASGLLAAWALTDWAVRREGLAAMPLGHHLLLGWVLVGMFPIGVARARRGPFGWWLVPLLVLAAALGTGSTLVVAALLAQACFLPRSRRWRRGALVTVGVLVVVGLALLRFGPWRPDEVSVQARVTYWEAGWRGSLERPLSGWGPGATPWTLALHLRPVPGVNPPGELVGDLHSVPLELLYETGWPGAVLAFATLLLWLRARRREKGDALARSAAIGLLGVAVVGSGGVTLGTLAPWVLVAVLVACVGGGEPDRGGSRAGWMAYALAAGLLLAPLTVARFSYDRARDAPSEAEAAAWLDHAVKMDPRFPLYRARRAWLDGPDGAEQAVVAAEQAVGSADLWLAAGASDGVSPDEARNALLTAWRLDRLSALPPFLAALRADDPARAARLGARSLASEPFLAAAVDWGGELPAREETLALLARWRGIDPGWRLAAVEALRDLPTGGPTVRLAREIDGDPASSMSLHLFRRLPWPTDIASVRLWRDAVERIDLPRPVEMPGTAGEAFPECEESFHIGD